MTIRSSYLWPIIVTVGLATQPALAANDTRHPVPREHPRLLGSRDHLQQLAKDRAEAYHRTAAIARGQGGDDYSKMISMSLVCAIEQDAALGKNAVDMAMKYIRGPIKIGHVPFAQDLALCGIVYDLCHEYWTAEQQVQFHQYLNRTVDENRQSETHVFHNGWYGYKNWGIGVACYASYYENERSPVILKDLEDDWHARAAPALNLAGAGGGWAEGYYINYWLYEWLFFCEVARTCEGVDYCADAMPFFSNRAVASMFEAYPEISTYNSRRPIPMGDGGGRVFGGDRDKVLSARRILVNYFRDDPNHQAVHTFNETTPRSSVGAYAYKDFLWRDPGVPKGDLKSFKLSHISTGPGYVYARSSWAEDATYFFFKCGDRFTAHQHLDNGHFLIYKLGELAGDGGHYDSFGSSHDVNYHLRSIAHSTVLVYDPCEAWPQIRAGQVSCNDGGQSHSWPHHNGAVQDPAEWRKGRKLYDIADIVAFEDRGAYLYVAGDCTRAYQPDKLTCFTRQIVFLRPGTFFVFDRATSKASRFKKTWVLQAMKPPTQQGEHWVVTNGEGRLSIQTLLPANPQVRLVSGPELYNCGGNVYPPERDTGPAPECRMEVSPSDASTADYFLHVLTTMDSTASPVTATITETDSNHVTISSGPTRITFRTDELAGEILINGVRRTLTTQVSSGP